MSRILNEFGQPVGAPVPGWTPRRPPPLDPMQGRLCRLEHLDPAGHAAVLHEAFAADPDDRHWTYLPYGPFASSEIYEMAMGWMRDNLEQTIFYVIIDEATQSPVGVAAYLRIDVEQGSIEVGHLRFSNALQRRPAATEAMYLMMRRAFDELGYRRYEWRCDSANAPSLAAARRLGFRFEGTFRQAMVVKGRNRDTTWLSILDTEWPAIKAALEGWLDPANFADDGQQRRRLGDFMAESRGPETAGPE